MNSEYFYSAIAPFMRTDDFIYFLFTHVNARNRALARDYAIVRDAWAMGCAPKPSVYAIIKYAARINSPLARLERDDPHYAFDRVGVANACAYGHEDLAKWFWKRMYHSYPICVVKAAFKGSYFANNRALIDYFKTLDRINIRHAHIFMSAYYGAAKGGRSLEWTKEHTREFPFSAPLFEICRTVSANKSGYEYSRDISKSDNRAVRQMLWRHWIKHNDCANIAKYMSEDSDWIAMCDYMEYTLWKYASHDTLCAYTRARCEFWDYMHPRALYTVCQEGILERVRTIFDALEGIIDSGLMEMIITHCLNGMQYNLAVTEFLVGRLARLPPLSDKHWKKLLVGMVSWTSVAELQYVANHADLLNHHISLRMWRSLAISAGSDAMREYIAQRLAS